jgi:integrase
MYKGKIFTVTCRDLGCLATKESSYRAANAWWTAKRAELDHLPLDDRVPESVAIREKMLDYLALEPGEDRQTRTRLQGEIEALKSGARINKPDGVAFDPTAALPVAEKIAWMDRIATVEKHHEWTGKTEVPVDRTIGALADKYAELERSRYEGGEISIATWAQERACLMVFRDQVGSTQDVSVLTGDRYEKYWSWVNRTITSIGSKKRHLRIARSFITWLSEKGVIPLPSNLSSRRLRFKGEPKPIATMSREQVRTLIDHATGQLRLHLLLMLNCGFTQIDITELRQVEVDWATGRITRRRTKAVNGGYSKAPTVTWALWPETFTLLNRYRQPTGDRVLLTEDGTLWMTRRPKGDTGYTKTDNIVSAFRRLLDKLAKSHPGKEFGSLSELRATASTMLDNHENYGRYVQHFLGQSPRSVAAAHYVTPSQVQFDHAVAWLGEQFGF